MNGAGAVHGHDAEMICSARTQSTDVRTHVLVRVPSLGLGGGHGTIAGRCPVFKMYARTESVRIDRAIERG